MNINYYLTRPKAKKITSIYARICYSGFQFKFYIPEKINPKFWSKEKGQAKHTENFKEHPEFNQRLKDIASDIGSTLLNYKNNNGGEIPRPETFRQLLNTAIKKIQPEKEVKRTFLSFFREIIEQSKSGVRLNPKTGRPISPNTLKTYVTTLRNIEAFQETRKRPIEFENIDLEFYADYTEYLTKKLKLSSNSIGSHIKTIKLIMNEATERGINKNLSFKSKKFKTVTEKTDSVYLNEKELKEIELLDLSGIEKLKTVRDLFLIGCHTGLRYSDFSILKPEQIKDGFIEVTQTKTGNKVIIPVHPTVKKIIDQYNGELPKSISNQKTNEYLKELAKKVTALKTPVSVSFTKGGSGITKTVEKWELITSHTARRSFASNEYLAGTPSEIIMAITGHRTEKDFLRYVKLTPSEHAKRLKQHWEKRNHLKAV